MKIIITSIIDLRKTAHSRLHQFVRHLSRNHEVTVLSINDWWKAKQADTKLYSQSFEDTLQGINIKYLTERRLSPILQEVFSVVVLDRILKEINYTKFDMHLNYNTLISGYFVARKLKSAGISTVYDIADDLPQMIRTSPQISPALRPLGGLVGSIMINRNIGIAQKTVCTTSSLPDSLHIPQHKFELIPNGVDTELFRGYPSQQLRQKLNIGADFVVGYVGVLREWVDLEPVFAALSQLNENYNNMKILVVGEEGEFQYNQALAQRYGVSNRVVFTGTVPYAKVPQYIACMDVGLIPFKANAVSESALPLKLFEYMACQKPVICSQLTSVAQAVNGKVLYASNEKEYRDKLIALYENRQLRQRMGAEGRKFVEQSYNWSTITSRLETILIQVAGGRK